MAKATPDVGLNPFTGNLQLLRKDSFAYYTIDSGHEVLIPSGTEQVLTNGITLDGSLEVNGSLTLLDTEALVTPHILTTTSDVTLTNGNDYVMADASSNTVTITLPTLAERQRPFHIKAINTTFAVTVDANGSETIDGYLTKTILLNSTLKIISDGTQWRIV